MNLHFQAKNAAVQMVDFLKSILPLRIHVSKEVYSFVKYTWVIEVPKICKDDMGLLSINIIFSFTSEQISSVIGRR